MTAPSDTEARMPHLEDVLNETAIEAPILHNGRQYVTKDTALAGMTAIMLRARNGAIEECHQWLDSQEHFALGMKMATAIRQLKDKTDG